MGQTLKVVKSEPLPSLTVVKSEPVQAPPSQPQPPRSFLETMAAAYGGTDEAEAEAAKQTHDAYMTHGPRAVVGGVRDIAQGNVARGTRQVMSGAGVTTAPFVAPVAIPAAMAAPGATAVMLGTGAATQAVVPPVARAMGASEDQAGLMGDVASMATGGATAKYGVPALARWSTTRRAAAMGEDYWRATRDTMAALGVNAEDVHAARPFLEAVHAHSVPIAGKEDAAAQFVKAGNVAIDEIEQHVASLVQQFPSARVPPSARAITGRVAKMPGVSKSDYAAARAVIEEYGLDKEMSLDAAESLRIRLNAENRSILEGTGVRQRTAVLTNPAFVARQTAANELRDGIYGTLEQHGVEGIRDLRRAEGAILKLRNAADPLTRGLRSESTVARTGETSLTRRMAQRLAPMVGAGGGAFLTGGNPIGAAGGAEVMRDLTAGLVGKNLSKNELLERAFRQSFTSTPVMSVQRVPRPMPSHTQRLLTP